jgi:hypothetical protein
MSEAEELVRSVSLKWPASIDFKVQYIMLASFKHTRYVGYYPLVNVEPERSIVDYAHKVQERVRENVRGDYIPDLLGFYRCKVHYGDDAPSGIYLFVDKICKEAEARNIGVDSLMTAVFYHEFAHLLAHTIALHKPAEVNDERNFEEPFCELYAYYATFISQLPKETVKILNRDVELRCKYVKPVLSDVYNLRAVSKGDGEVFKMLSRPLPYGWFNHFMNVAQSILRSQKLILALAEKALDGTLSTYALGQCSCDRSNVFLINAKPLHEYPEEEAKAEFPALLVASALTQQL